MMSDMLMMQPDVSDFVNNGLDANMDLYQFQTVALAVAMDGAV